ncbi:hypothetical protein KFE25_002368 [Diacronema lutheri]|uniref:Uncharacterized protein n=1 Tax=Diacronema lutheri TaxID=2081491 RepID=A0A8J5XI79_DIALT|nr:hypothetical protein KFE25_002368 [Diacronema lutheri]
MYANKVVLANSARLSMLELRHLELDLYASNSRQVAFKGVLIAAIGWSGLIYTKKDYYQLADPYFAHAYPVVMMLIVGYSFLTVVQFNLIAMAAPGLALRGPDGSVHLAVEGMIIEYRAATRWFAQSVLSTLLGLVAYAWSGGEYRPLYAKLSLTALALAFSLLLYAQATHVARQFAPSAVYAGAFYPDEFGRGEGAAELLVGMERAGQPAQPAAAAVASASAETARGARRREPAAAPAGAPARRPRLRMGPLW